jgi:ankyrin repeat protein
MPRSTLPELPARLTDFINQLAKSPDKHVTDILEPYKGFEAYLRELYAQDPGNAVLDDPLVNAVPIFNGQENHLTIRARDLKTEDEAQRSKYIMPLGYKNRKLHGSMAIVPSMKDFQHQFNIFSELSLSEMDWSNVVAAGSSVLTPLLPVPKEYAGSKRELRKYYHDIFTPASDIDLFLYGLTEEEAKEKIKQIERGIKDSILTETTTIRTKNAITIASKYPNRHVQIVLRIYKSLSEILTGFDVDCSCVAYDGKQVYASPRAIGSLITQINRVDLSRRSPSYESRLSKYTRRGFEIYWPELDRSRIDPTIFERSFARTVGLARLLVLERLPTQHDRENFLTKRREERGRSQKYQNRMNNGLRGNVKEAFEDEVADWAFEDDISNYHSFTIPYGERFHARRIEKLLYTKDLLLNAEWNTKERKVKLHRHPAFFGDAEDIFEDCCGHCPNPSTPEEEKIAEEESKNFVSGKISFLTDDPGRQEIGSFNPITDTDWCEMGYVQPTEKLCQAIANCDLALVQKLLDEDQIDPNARDYTGRTSLHLAVVCSTPEIVGCLLDHGAYLVPRLAAGETVMHLAATRGNVEILKLLNEKSEENKAEADKRAREDDDGVDLPDDMDESSDSASEASGETSTFIKVESVDKFMKKDSGENEKPEGNKIEVKDDILDPDAVAWDSGCSPIHIATVFGNVEALNYLLNDHGSDPNVPIKLRNTWNNCPRAAILSLVLALTLPAQDCEAIAAELIDAGARCTQADLNRTTAFQYYVNQGVDALETIVSLDRKHAMSILNYINFPGSSWYPVCQTPLTMAIQNKDLKTAKRLLQLGATPTIEYDAWLPAYMKKNENNHSAAERMYSDYTEQPIMLAINRELPELVRTLVEHGVDINSTNKYGSKKARDGGIYFPSDAVPRTVLDELRAKIDELESIKPQNGNEPFKPEPLLDDSHYLSDHPEGSYSQWSMKTQLKDAKKTFNSQTETYNSALKNSEEHEGRRLKSEAVSKLIKEFKETEKYLLDHGAKGFYEIETELAADAAAKFEANKKLQELRQLQNRTNYRFKPKPWEFEYRFSGVPQLTDNQRADYVRLFTAAWDGNSELVQELTTEPRGENKDIPPLTIGVTDGHGHNPFSIAFFRGHVDLAFKILSIAQAQYEPRDIKLSYTMNESDEDYDENENSYNSDEELHSSGTNDDGPILYSRLPAAVRDQFTVEDIGAISTLVNSKISPVTMMQVAPYIDGISGGILETIKVDRKANLATERVTPLEYAMKVGDHKLFDALLDAAISYQDLEGQVVENKSRKFEVSDKTLRYAFRLGRIDMISKLMSRTCAGVPLTELVEKTGLKSTKKPKYYQGLSIRGQKNEAWAQSYRNGGVPFSSQGKAPLLLQAAQEVNIETFEWLLSDAPIRLYQEYATNNATDNRLQILSKSKDGFEKAIIDWLGAKGKQQAIVCFQHADRRRELCSPLRTDCSKKLFHHLAS